MKSKTVYIIPGSGEKTTDSVYKKIISLFKKQGFETIPVNIDWNYKVMSDYIEQFSKKFKKHKKTYFFGFSLGAMISFISASKLHPDSLILCSLSPWFKEDLKTNPKSWERYVGKRMRQNLKNYSFDKLIKGVKCKTILVQGDKEGKQIDKRVGLAHKKIKGSKLHIAKGAKHNISQKEYFDVVKEAISKL